MPTKFGISFSEPFLNQAGALVHIYNDGNVLLHHGGTEMGQGLYTKMIQVRSFIWLAHSCHSFFNRCHFFTTATCLQLPVQLPFFYSCHFSTAVTSLQR